MFEFHYPEGMKTISTPQLLPLPPAAGEWVCPPAPSRPGLSVLLGQHGQPELVLPLAALLACRDVVLVLDGGNRCNAYLLARAVGRLQRGAVQPILVRIHLSRGFTCYQMAAMLANAPAGQMPVLIADLLNTFQDESVALFERRRLLDECIQNLHRLSEQGVVIASLRPPAQPQVDATGMLERVQSAADQVWFHEELSPPAIQPALL